MRPALPLALTVFTCTAALAASTQSSNLHDLSGSDLCPPTAYVTIDDEDDGELAADIEGQLDKYATLYGLKYGDSKTCSATTYLSVDAFKTKAGAYSYLIEFGVELRGDVRASLGERTVTVSAPRIWTNSYYGSYSSLDNLKDGVTDRVRDYYDEFALDWRAAHP